MFLQEVHASSFPTVPTTTKSELWSQRYDKNSFQKYLFISCQLGSIQNLMCQYKTSLCRHKLHMSRHIRSAKFYFSVFLQYESIHASLVSIQNHFESIHSSLVSIQESQKCPM